MLHFFEKTYIKSLIAFFAITCLLSNTVFANASMLEKQYNADCLAPKIILPHESLRIILPKVLRQIDKTELENYKSIFSSVNSRLQPRWILESKELDKLLRHINDILNLAELLEEKSSYFKNIFKAEEIQYLDDILLIDLISIDVAAEDDYAETLKKILTKGRDRLERIRGLLPKVALLDDYKFLINRLDRKLNTALVFLNPYMPIENQHWNKNIISSISDELRKKIESHITWENMQADDYSGNRKIILYLDQPLMTDNGKEIWVLEIKGVVYRNEDTIVPPLKELYRIMSVQRINSDQHVTIFQRLHLKGALPLNCAKREFMILNRLQKKGKTENDYPIGYGEYLGYTWGGKKFGYLITGVSSRNKERIGDWFVDKYFEVFQLTRTFQKRFAHFAKDMFRNHPERLKEYGRTLREFHDGGYYHGYPHMFNVHWDEKNQKAILGDFEASKYIQNLPAKNRVAYRLLDLASAYSHFLTTIYGNTRMSNGELVSQTKMSLSDLSNGFGKEENPFHLFLEGYFGADTLTHDIDSIFEQFIDLSCCGIFEPLYEMDESLIKLLMRIVEGKSEYKESVVIEKQKGVEKTFEFIMQAI